MKSVMECVLEPEMFGTLDARLKDTFDAQSIATNAVMNHLMEKIEKNEVRIKKNGTVLITVKYKMFSSLYRKGKGVRINRICKNVMERFNESDGRSGWKIACIEFGGLSTTSSILYGIGIMAAIVPGIMVLNNKMKVIFHLKKEIK